MAVYNLQALADKTKYLISQGMTAQEAEAQVFQEAGINEMDPTAYAEYQRLISEGTTASPYARNDRERILDRRAATNYGRYEQAEQEPPQEPV